MSWYQLKQQISEGVDTVVIPVASFEQHGKHLPLYTDSLVDEWIAEEAAKRSLGVVVAPTVCFGISGNHMDFPGTINLAHETFINLIVDIGMSFNFHGFKYIIYLNGHGGNNATLATAMQILRNKISYSLVGWIDWASMVGNAEKETLEGDIIWHADEGETSTVLYIAPELVNMELAQNEKPKNINNFSFVYEDFVNRKIDFGLPSTKTISDSGTVGYACMGTPEKGRIILEEVVKNLSNTLNEMRH